MSREDIDPGAPPSGTGCADCLAGDGPGWWFHLRRCARCGRVGCCDSSPSQHATHHYQRTGHPIVQSFEPGERWFWSYALRSIVPGEPLAPPTHHPHDQPVPGPRGKVPADWRTRLHRPAPA
jgi:hypothetical protein